MSRCQVSRSAAATDSRKVGKVSALPTCNGSATAVPPALSIIATVSSARGWLLLNVRITPVPRLAIWIAALRPIPELPPVTIATRMVHLPVHSWSCCVLRGIEVATYNRL